MTSELSMTDRAVRRRGRHATIRSLLRAGLVAVFVIGAYYLFPVRAATDFQMALRMVIVGVALGIVVAWEIRAVGRAEFPRLRAIDAIVSSVSVMVIAFAVVYLNFSLRDPESFNEPLELRPPR